MNQSGTRPAVLRSVICLLVILGVTSGCSQEGAPSDVVDDSTTTPVAGQQHAGLDGQQTGAAAPAPAKRQAYYGDLHVHTFYSFDAFIFATRATPDDAYRYAKGEPLAHPSGFDMQLDRPLDFYAVTDHAMFLGMLPAMADTSTEVSKLPFAKPFQTAETAAERREAFLGIRPFLAPGKADEVLDMDVVKSAWQDIRDAAARHNDPGRFTTFIAYEYTSGPESQNLHRNVIFQDDKAPDVPFSRLESQNPEMLWQWMDSLRDQGIESLAIPHNSNGSNGQMFKLADWAGDPLDATYAEVRMRNEPLVEVTQVKGDSETHPLLSPNDEWADFETMPYRIATWTRSDIGGSYVRQALGNGIAFQDQQGFNPFKFGLVGASDTHTGAASLDESNYFSKVGLLDGTAQLRGSVPLDEPDAEGNRYEKTYYTQWGASGLTGVWAEQNSRAAIYAAFRRKETFATSGPRMQVRLFAAPGLDPDIVQAPDLAARGYAEGVPMGSDLLPGEGAPGFVVEALRDPRSGPLQRLQIVKGWIEEGEPREQVFDIACADGLEVDKTTHRCPDNGARVNLANCAISSDKGAAELKGFWQDPQFNPAAQAFYYARVLENPTCRWSTWDAVRHGVAPREDLPATIQERAYTSPVWYQPG
ncbi:MAG: DUF3604 domain-containing protein [Pseudomonadota bacterium]